MDIETQINKTIDLEEINPSFDELETAFYNNANKIKQLDKSDPERERLLDQNDIILEKVHKINWG